jgi:UDP-N-acetylmuramoylalanine--D-glutamate ligase
MTDSSPSPALQNPWPYLQRVAVLGLGRSGVAAAHLLKGFPLHLILSDARADLPPDLLPPDLLPPQTTLTLGGNSLASPQGIAQLAVLSPGLTLSAPVIREAHLRGVPLLSELNLGAMFLDQLNKPMVAVSGTDGKTTTTALTAHLLQSAGMQTEAVGNIGEPLCEAIPRAHRWDLAVVEASAFQLWSSPTFKPHILIGTNVASDHLDYFMGDAHYYALTKRKPLSVMGSTDFAILNAADPLVRTWPAHTDAQAAWYAYDPAQIPPGAATWGAVIDGTLTLHQRGRLWPLLPAASLFLPGAHNALNALSASLAALSLGVTPEAITAGLRTFSPPPHRIQPVATAHGVTFVDDSKATNPHAASAALRALPPPSVLIAGGVDKGLPLDAWTALILQTTAATVVIGQLSERLRAALTALSPRYPVVAAATMEEAVEAAYQLARQHGAPRVLLSPGCSSFDMFKSYSDRGLAFARAAQALTP